MSARAAFLSQKGSARGKGGQAYLQLESRSGDDRQQAGPAGSQVQTVQKAAAADEFERMVVLLASQDSERIDELDPCTGMSALHHATRNNSEHCVRQLLALRADPMVEARDGKSALLDATENGHWRLTKLMLQEAQGHQRTRPCSWSTDT